MTNQEVCGIFNEIAELLEILGENPFKSRAYRNAARVLENAGFDVQDLVREGRLEEVPGIGSALAAKIRDLVTTGRLAYYEDLKQKVPPDVREMLKIPGVGAKTVQLFLHHGITSLQALEAAARDQRLRSLPGIGKKTEEEILRGLAAMQERQKRWLLSAASRAAEEIGGYLAGLAEAEKVAVAGSYRRGRETVGDLDFVVASDDAPAVIARFVQAPWVREIVAEGDLKATVITVMGDPGRPLRGPSALLCFHIAPLHRLQGAQHRPAGAGAPA